MRPIVVTACAGVAFGMAAPLDAQEPADWLPKITVAEIMDAMVMPNAQIVWDAVTYDVSDKGEKVTGPKTDAFTLLPRIYRGDHVPHDHVVELRSRDRITIEADRPIEIEADGEPVGRTPATIDVIPHPIRMKL